MTQYLRQPVSQRSHDYLLTLTPIPIKTFFLQSHTLLALKRD